MGRYYWDKKTTAEYCRALSVQWLKKYDYFRGFRYGGIKWTSGWGKESDVGFVVDTGGDVQYIKFNYTVTVRDTGEKTDYDYQVLFVTTPCNYGGVRYWFVCPLVVDGKPCLKRVGTLYIPPDGKYFGCRRCYNLSYESRNETHSGKFAVFNTVFKKSNQLDKIRDSIGFPIRAGRPTKKFMKAMKIANELNEQSSVLDKMPF